MKEMSNLSCDLSVITAEINSYKQIAGQSIFEIGKRLKHVKENDLAHGKWMSWCQEEAGFSSDQANKYIAVYDRFANSDSGRNLGVASLYLLTSFSDGQIETPHVVPSTGETKTVDEMTVRELREVKRALKEAEARANQAEQIADSERKARERAEEDADKPPEVVTEYKTEYVDNTPNDYEKIRQENERYREKFGDINSFDGNTRRVSNRHDVMAMIQAFAHDSRQLLRKYSFLDEYAREIADMPDGVNEEFKSSLEAINRFVWKMAEHLDVGNDDVIDVDTINH